MKELKIYCDGSRDDFEELGVGIVFVSNNNILEKVSYKLPFKGESYTSEYISLIYALSMLDSYVEHLTLFTDQSCIVKQVMGFDKPKNKIIVKLLEILKREITNAKCKYFRISHVKSHNKNAFHDLADKLAEEGRKKGQFI